MYKGGIKEFDAEGFKHGDVFIAVKPTKRVTAFLGTEDGQFEKYLQNGKKTFHIKGGAGYKSAYFNHVKEGGDTPSGHSGKNLSSTSTINSTTKKQMQT